MIVGKLSSLNAREAMVRQVIFVTVGFDWLVVMIHFNQQGALNMAGAADKSFKSFIRGFL
jgi:hypothetical protein